MKIIEHAKQGLQNLCHAKLRSILALLGVLVGTASVVAMVLGGELATNEALRQFKSLGTDLLALNINTMQDDSNQSSQAKTGNLTLAQSLSIPEADPAILEAAPYTQIFHLSSFQGEPLNAIILGVSDSFAPVAHISLQQGRFISLADQYAFYCVIGQGIYHDIKKITHANPIGQQIQIGKNIFVIVGVAKHWPENNFVYANIDHAILVPILASMAISKYANIGNILMRLAPHANINQVEAHIDDLLNRLNPGKQMNYRSAKELIAKMRKQSDILTIFLGLIGSISLLVGGIGVMNIMLVSVVERKREIGIRLAVGATKKDIGALFLLEAIMLSLLGGFLGVLIGIFIAYLIAIFSHWQFTLFLLPPLVGFSVAVAVGIFFGFYPAYLASKLNPIDALRAE